MPSAVKTPNYGLNQWEGNEYPKRQDFVDDNMAIDAQMKMNTDAVAAAQSTANAAATFKNAKGLTFPVAATQFQITDVFITADTLVSVAPTSKKENFWDVESFAGYFIIYSKDGDPDAVAKAETNAVTFDWSATKGGA